MVREIPENSKPIRKGGTQSKLAKAERPRRSGLQYFASQKTKGERNDGKERNEAPGSQKPGHVHDFGYDRAAKGLYPELWPANAFIGNYLRLDLLDRYGRKAELYDNIKGYFNYMAEKTGTLWELRSDGASCNHGFASHVLHWMNSLGLLSHN